MHPQQHFPKTLAPECDDISTNEESQTPVGDEPPDGYVLSPEKAHSDTEPPSDGGDQQQEDEQTEEALLAQLANQLQDLALTMEGL